MCGIAGFVTRDGAAVGGSTIRRMTDSIRHRGPDAEGFFEEEAVSLGHRRLSIVDPQFGAQPMFNEDGRYAIVFNGEIYNHPKLAPELVARGHIYRTHCDTETIVHGFEEFGEGVVERLRGMFAFALWDRKTRELVCARDRLGIKPFYYYADANAFVFASEIKALLEHPAVSAALEPALLAEYLAFGFSSDERTLFRGIRKLMPGCYLRVSATNVSPRITRYWDLPAASAAERRSDSDWIEATRRYLEDCVESHLMSDVPLGMFLSGGLDSSAIAAVMQRKIARPAMTFSVGYAEERYSELSYARTVAGAIGTEHREVRVSREDFFGALPKLIWHEDEPISWPSSVSLYFVSKLAAEHVKVVLTGEGSDELFAGYGRYGYQMMNRRMLAGYRFVPGVLRGAVRRWIATTGMLSGDLRRKLNHTVLGRAENLESLYLANFYGAFSLEEQRNLTRASGDAYVNFLRYFDEAAGKSPIEQLLHADQKTYLLELLMKQDQMSMAASIESRVPFLDHEFVEFAARIPARLKLRGSSGKYVLKQAVRGLLPEEIIHRKKMGFPTPLKSWLLEPGCAGLCDDLLSPKGLLAETVDLKSVRELVERHRSGREDATDRIWNLLNLQIWGDVFLMGRRERWEPMEACIGEPAARTA